MKNIKKLLLLLILIVAGVQCMWSQTVYYNHHAKTENVTIDNVTYECVHTYTTYSKGFGNESDTIPWSHEYYASIIST